MPRLGIRLLLVTLGVLAGGWIALGRVAVPRLLVFGTLALLALSIARAAIAHRPGVCDAPWPRGTADFLTFAGVVVGAVAAGLTSGAALAVAFGAFVLLVVRPGGRGGAVLWAALAGLPLEYGALAVGRAGAGLVPWLLAAWLVLVRGLAAAEGSRSAVVLAAVLAVLFVPASLVLPARSGYGAPYFLTAIFAQLAVLVAAAQLFFGRRDRVNALLGGAMAIGLVALVLGRVAWRG